jgi:hypothetical protein
MTPSAHALAPLPSRTISYASPLWQASGGNFDEEQPRLEGNASCRPLIYPILFESLLLTVMFISFHVAEHLVIGLLKRETFAESIPAIRGNGRAGVVCVAVILFVALIPFFAFRNVSRELGSDRLKAMLFGTAVKVTGDR